MVSWWLIGFVDWLQAQCQSQWSTHDRQYGLSYIIHQQANVCATKSARAKSNKWHCTYNGWWSQKRVRASVCVLCFWYCLLVECKSSADLLTNNAIQFDYCYCYCRWQQRRRRPESYFSLCLLWVRFFYYWRQWSRTLQSINYLDLVCELFQFSYDDNFCCCCYCYCWCTYSGFLR